jgi:protein TonB
MVATKAQWIVPVLASMAAHAAGLCAVGMYCGWARQREAAEAPALRHAARGSPVMEVFLVPVEEPGVMGSGEEKPESRLPEPARVAIAPPDAPRAMPVEMPSEPQPKAAAPPRPCEAPVRPERERWFVSEPVIASAAAAPPLPELDVVSDKEPRARKVEESHRPQSVVFAAKPSQVTTAPAKAAPATAGESHGLRAGGSAAEPGADSGAQPADGIRPEYPPSCIRRGEQGLVLVEVHVLADGSADDARIVKSSGFRELDCSALASARKARYTPAHRGGEPIAAWAVLPVRFVLR